MNSQPRTHRAPVHASSIRATHTFGCLTTLQVWDAVNCVWQDRAKVRRADMDVARGLIERGLL